MLLNLTLPMDDGGLDMDEDDEEVQPSPRKPSFTKRVSSMELIVTPPSTPRPEPVPDQPQLSKKLSSRELLIQQVRVLQRVVHALAASEVWGMMNGRWD